MSTPDASVRQGPGDLVPSTRRSALIIGHPGHELRVHGWLEAARPLVCVLTDGSGHGDEPRLDASRALLTRAGCELGGVFGRFSDRDFYEALLAGEQDRFVALAEELADTLAARGIDRVVCDAAEEYNPAHDVCNWLAWCAARLASRRLARAVDIFEFTLVAPPAACPDDARDRAIWVTLDEPALQRKLAAAHAYSELREEVERALRQVGPEAFRTECLRAAEGPPPLPRSGELPFYERHGASRVEEGHYTRVLTFDDHLGPLAARLRAAAEA